MSELTVEYVGHACLLIAADDEHLITDPWFTNPVMANSWYHVPRYARTIQELPDLNYIYVSHEHADHLDIPALRQLTPSATIIIPAFGDGGVRLSSCSDTIGTKRVCCLIISGHGVFQPN